MNKNTTTPPIDVQEIRLYLKNNHYVEMWHKISDDELFLFFLNNDFLWKKVCEYNKRIENEL